MRLESSKEVEQGGRMRRSLVQRGFVKSADGSDRHEVWTYGEDRQVVLTRVDSLHDPIEAEVFDRRFTPDVTFAYNAKGLDVLLLREAE